jgi:hypothetical protein
MKAILYAGSAFAGSVATILGVAGRYRLSDTVALIGIAAVCLIAAFTMLTAILTARWRGRR